MLIVVAFVAGLCLGIAGLWLWARGEIALRDERLSAAGHNDEQWQEHLKALTGSTLQEASSSLVELTESRLAPIRETLQRFETQSRALEERRLREISAIPPLLQVAGEAQEA